MASLQDPEIVLAQRLASNEKPIRSKAMRKLRKYISVRSQNASGGFSGEELLKLWKGLFYCLWMQDKPLLQEELSKQISALIHSFHHEDKQLMYLESFLQTFKREWTGIDRLRMDKFYQMVRFMFRQTFEMLRRKNWDSSLVTKFLQLLTSHVLQKDSEVPSGLQLHVLDLYMSELAAVGSEELTADQNLMFIEPFCKTAAKTKNRMLFSAICSRIFSTIIDQAPFAVEDLMKEVNVSDSDSGQASEDEDERRKDVKNRTACKKQMNGNKPDDDEEDDDEDELLHPEDSDTPLPDDDIGPVLQFDYAALADKLFVLASRSSTPGLNRQKLYKIIKVLRELSEGVFPDDEYPEDVSTDEDDDMFGSKKRMKRAAKDEGDEKDAPTAKKSKADPGNKIETISKQNKKDSVDAAVSNTNKRKKKKKKKAVLIDKSQEQAESPVNTTETSLKCGRVKQLQSSTSSIQVTEGQTQKGPAETVDLLKTQSPSVLTTEEEGKAKPGAANGKKKKGKLCDSEIQERQEPAGTASVAHVKKKNKKKVQKVEANTEIISVNCETSGKDKTAASSEAADKSSTKRHVKSKKAAAELKLESVVSNVNPNPGDLAEGSPTPGSVKRTHQTAQVEQRVVAVEGKVPPVTSQPSTPVQRKKMKTKRSKQEVNQGQMDQKPLEMAAGDHSVLTPLKKKKKSKGSTVTEGKAGDMNQSGSQTDPETQVGGGLGTDDSCTDPELPSAEADVIGSTGKIGKKKKRKIPVEFEFEGDEAEEVTTQISCCKPAKSSKKSKLNSGVNSPVTPLSLKKKRPSDGFESDFITFQSRTPVPTPLFCKTSRSPKTPSASKKKRRTPSSDCKKVTFGLKNNKTAEFRKTDRSLLLSPDGSSRVPFDPQQKPRFGVLKSPLATESNLRKTPSSAKKTQR